MPSPMRRIRPLIAASRYARPTSAIERGAWTAACVPDTAPLQDFEQTLTDEQQAKFSGGAKSKSAVASQSGGRRACGASSAALDWSIDQIDKTVQPTEQQRTALADVQQAFGKAASDLEA